ncbi:MAG: ribosome maturation factor RimM [Dysgonamonadaceae bacterium]|jgi:16S rRNA processing protein RimM|nr:ribosome maturation factor RimM [Dysgonamonadaceae bacterium]
MISREDLIKIGHFNKPHGIKGELSFVFTDDSFDESECPFLVCEPDGIFVPFRIEAYRFKSDSLAFIKLKGIDNEERAKIFSNMEVYFPKQYLKPDSSSEIYSWDYFIGFTLQDAGKNTIGQILDVDETTINILFVLEYKNNELLIPVSEEIVLEIDEKKKIIQLELPDGILEL